MPRYIDADKLFHSVKAFLFDLIEKNVDMVEITEFNVMFKELLAKEPTADVAPVVHGKWVNKNDTPHCTVCDYIPAFDVALDDIYYSPFCPNCGAKMDLED